MLTQASKTSDPNSACEAGISQDRHARPPSQNFQETQLQSLLGLFITRASRLSGKDGDRATWEGLTDIAISLAGCLRIATGQNDIPVQLRPILQLRNGRVIWVPYREEGALIPSDNGFEVRVQVGTPLVRVRATVAHEVGHTFFYNDGLRPPVRVVARSGIHSRREEALCWDFARELLLPRDAFLGGIEPSPSPDAVLRLARKFCVSPQLVCRRAFYDLGVWRHAGAFLLTSSGATSNFDTSVYIGRTMKQSLRRSKVTLRGKGGLILPGGPWNDEIMDPAARNTWATQFHCSPFRVQVRRYGPRKEAILGVFTAE